METLAACTRPTQVQSIKCSRSQKGKCKQDPTPNQEVICSSYLLTRKKSVSPNIVSLSVSITLPGMPRIRSSWLTQNKHHSFWCEFCILFWYILPYLSFDCLFCFWPFCFYVVYLYWLLWKKKDKKENLKLGGWDKQGELEERKEDD